MTFIAGVIGIGPAVLSNPEVLTERIVGTTEMDGKIGVGEVKVCKFKPSLYATEEVIGTNSRVDGDLSAREASSGRIVVIVMTAPITVST